MRLFGPTHEDIWRILSKDIEAEFVVNDSVFKKYEVIKKYEDWIIILDTCSSNDRNKSVFTRVHCVFSNKHGFKFKLFGEYFNNYFPNFFDMQDIKVNYGDLSEKFVVRSNSEVAIKKILENKTIRELINTKPDILFEIINEQLSEYTTNTESTLSIKIPGIIKDNEILKELFELVGDSLLEIEKISNEFENLQFNNFTHFDVIKNSVKNSLLESVPYKNFKKEVISNVNKIIDKTNRHHSHTKDGVSNSKLEKANEINEITYTENGCKEIDSKILGDSREDKFFSSSNVSTSITAQTDSVDTNNQKVDLNSLSIDNSNLWIDNSNLNIDTSNLKVDDSYLKIDDSYLKKDSSYLKTKE